MPVIVSPDQSEVISLAPEFMTPQDVHGKQDCEVAAAKRWIDLHKQDFKVDSVTLLGDDLYSRQPMCETILASKMNFIFNCLPSSHATLYEWLESLERLGEIKAISLSKRHLRTLERYKYRYVNHVPLRNEEPSLLVN